LGFEYCTTLTAKVWEGEYTNVVVYVEDPYFNDNCCNWFNKLVVLLSIDPTNALAWGPGFILARLIFDLGASIVSYRGI